MGKQLPQITDRLQQFIENQQLFFVGTAAPEGKVNVSPKGMDTLKILDPKRVIWLNLTGSGNETAAHLLETNRMTIMFCAFAGNPMILRLYGTAKVIYPSDLEWEDLAGHFPPLPGARQIFDMEVQLVQTSCGFGVPLYHYEGQRSTLVDWAEAKGEQGIQEYQEQKNQRSIDGKPTGLPVA